MYEVWFPGLPDECAWASAIPYEPHQKQQPFHLAEAKQRALFCSRRFGKDEATVQESSRLLQLWSSARKPGHIIPRIHAWFLSPTYSLSRDWERRFQRIWPYGMRQLKSERSYYLPGDILLEFKSADNPERLVSVGLDLLCVTEAQLISSDAMMQLAPTLISPERFGKLLATGVPMPVPWMEDFKRAADDGDPRRWYYTGPSSENPYIDMAELEAEIGNCPPHERDSLYLGKWPSSEGAVFRGLARALSIASPVGDFPMRSKPETRGPFFDGLDPARLTDYMVYTSFERRADGRLHQVAFDRFHQQDWNLQVARTANNCGQYAYRSGCMDVTGLGDVVSTMLSNQRTSFVPVTFTPATKQALVTELSLALDNDEIRLFNHPLIRDEFRRFTYSVSKTGNYSYSAPAGYHDDIICSVALAVAASRKHKPMDTATRAHVTRSIAF